MFLTKPLNKTPNDSMFVDNNQMVTYTELNDSSSFPINAESNCIPKIKVEDISYQSDCSPMNWQRIDCYQPNQFSDNCMYVDTTIQTNNYTDPVMASTSCANGLVYTDLSHQYNEPSVQPENYQMVYSHNPITQQNGSIQAINEPNYQNRVEVSPDYSNCSQTSSMSPINTNIDVSMRIETRTDCLQTVAPTVMSALTDSSNLKNIQFMKTIEFLRATDLLNLTLQTAELIKKNLEIQKEINNTKQLLSRFVTT